MHSSGDKKREDAASFEPLRGSPAEQELHLAELARAANQGDAPALARLFALAQHGPEEAVVRALAALGAVALPQVLLFLCDQKRAAATGPRRKAARRGIHLLSAKPDVLCKARELGGTDYPELQPRRPEDAPGSLQRVQAANVMLLASIPAYCSELSSGSGARPANAPRLYALLQTYVREVLLLASTRADDEARATLQSWAREDASLERASMGTIAKALAQLNLADLAPELRSVIEDLRRGQSTIVQLIELRELLLHSARDASDMNPPRGAMRERAKTLAHKLERLLRKRSPDVVVDQLLVVAAPDHAGLRIGARYAITSPLTIGRNASSDLVIDDAGCSRLHARIVQLGGVGGPACLVDVSVNGTFLNHKPIKGTTLLADGDLIRIATVELRFLSGAT